MSSFISRLSKLAIALLLVVGSFGMASTAVAAGNINPTQNFSQFYSLDLNADSVDDFINWSPTNCGGTCLTPATVTDTAIIGDIWGESIGWIRLNPNPTGITPPPSSVCDGRIGVKNTCGGVLSGCAWGENAGWVNFSASQATIAPNINTATGKITGQVWAQNYGWIELSSPVAPAGYGSYNPALGLRTTWDASMCVAGTDGVCGTSNGKTFASAPGTDLCTTGSASAVSSSGNGWSWTCAGSGSGTTATCSAARQSGGGSSGGGTTNPPVNPPTNPPVNPPTNPPVNPPVNPPTNPGGGTTNPPVNPPTNPPVNPPTNPLAGPSDSGNTPTPNLPLMPVREISGDSRTFQEIIAGLGIWIPIIAAIGLLGTIPAVVSRLANLLLAFIFARKKTRGIVYDSVTKEPLDPAYVSVIDTVTGQEIMNQITDMEGRYGFVLKKGSYKLVANKTHYQFPSARLAGKQNDEVYSDLYFGDVFTVADEEQVVTMNIPMDPQGTDWNQEEKRRMSPLRFFTSSPKWFAALTTVLFTVGFFFSIFATYFYPNVWNIVITVLYIILGIAQVTGFGHVAAGKITKGGSPLGYAIVRVFNANLNREVARKVTSEMGSYYILVPKAEYYVTIEQKNSDGTYTKLFTSSVMRANHGVINKSFDL